MVPVGLVRTYILVESSSCTLLIQQEVLAMLHVRSVTRDVTTQDVGPEQLVYDAMRVH